MDRSFDRSTRDLIGSRLRLASDLKFTPQVHGEQTFYHIESPSRESFYRVGYREYVFITLLDGSHTLAQALTIHVQRLGAEALTQKEGVQLAEWLLECELARIAEGTTRESHDSDTPGSHVSLFTQLSLNPFWTKVPLGSPNRLLEKIVPWLGWTFSPLATLVGALIVLLGAANIAGEWGRFTASARDILVPHNWLWLGMVWLLLKLVHELGHSLCCKYYGCEVRQAGLIFVLFAPLAFVDVSACWRLSSKWRRIHVALAGMYAELVVAGVAAMAWSRVESPVIQQVLQDAIVMASLSALLFNANPLMRFDGYYVLSDLIEIPNLSNEGRRAWRQCLERAFYGSSRCSLQLAGARGWFVSVYGLLSAVWKLLICVSLTAAAATLFHGTGLLLAAFGVLAWLGRPLAALAVNLGQRYQERRASCLRAVSIGSLMMAAICLGLATVPCPGSVTAPAVVEYHPLTVIRSRVDGLVESVHVTDAEQVTAGQLLVVLRNDELVANLREMESAFQQGQVNRRIALDRGNAAETQIASRNLQALRERRDELRQRVANLRVLAPMTGAVIRRGLGNQVGVFVEEGQELLSLGNESNKELVVSIGQRDVEVAAPLIGTRVPFRLGSRSAFTGTLHELAPKASTDLPHEALGAATGGPLAVKPKADSKQAPFRLIEPRFRGTVRLPPDTARRFGAGEQGRVVLGSRDESIGAFSWNWAGVWYEQIWHRSDR